MEPLFEMRTLLSTPQVIKKFEAIVRHGKHEYQISQSQSLHTLFTVDSDGVYNGPAVEVFGTAGYTFERMMWFKRSKKSYFEIRYLTYYRPCGNYGYCIINRFPGSKIEIGDDEVIIE